MEIEKLEFGESKKENVSKESTEKINNAEQESLTALNTKPKEPVGGRFEKRKSALGKKWYILAGVVILLGLLMTYFIQNRIFYNNIPVIVNANDFVNAHRKDVVAIYGKPDEKSDENTNYKYYLDEYELEVRFDYNYVQWMRFTFNEPIEYKRSHKEVFYMLGLGEDYDKYSLNFRGSYISDSNGDGVGDGEIKTISLEYYVDKGRIPKNNKKVNEIFISYRTDLINGFPE